MANEIARPDGFKDKYETYAGMLYKIGVLYLGCREDAEDVLHEAFIRLMTRAPAFDSAEYEKAWLIRVTVNLCKNTLSGFWRRKITLSDGVARDVESEESRELLKSVLALPVKLKAPVHLYYYEGYGVADIAGILNISESAVKMRLKRGRELLKWELSNDE